MNIHQMVHAFNTKHKEGFTNSEIQVLVSRFPHVNMGKFNNALSGVSCPMVDGDIVFYKHDVEAALRCGVENRDMRQSEFD